MTSSFLIVFILQLFASAYAAEPYTITAISTCPRGKSTLECWELSEPPVISQDKGIEGSVVQKIGQLGGEASYLTLPPHFPGSAHNAPTVQYVAFLSGLAHITLIGSPREAWVYGGPQGLIIAADTAAVSSTGHITEYPGDTETTALQIPIAKDKQGNALLPAHRRLHYGPCPQNAQQ